MHKRTKGAWPAVGLAIVLVGVLFMQGAQAQPGWLGNLTWNGKIQWETALSTTSRANMWNQLGNPFNEREVQREGCLMPATLPCIPIEDTITRPLPLRDQDVNLAYARLELDTHYRFTENLRFRARLRGIFDPILFREYDPDAIGSQAAPAQTFNRRPNHFEHPVEDINRVHPFEWAGRDWMLDLPDFYLTYDRGSLTVRLGNQQIAWGQLLFFRTLDVPQGLDLRRHSVLDFAAEEFEDKRVPAPALRVDYQFRRDWSVDAHVQKFQPSVLPNPNNPYNIVASQFTVRDRYAEVRDQLNYGARVQGRIGRFDVQLLGGRRYNPEGAFRWAVTGIDRDPPGLPGVGAQLAQTPMESDPAGLYSAEEWFTFGAHARLDGVNGFNAILEDFDAPILALYEEGGNMEEVGRQLDLTFQLLGPMRGHIDRKYHRENFVGANVGFMIDARSGSFFDQMILNFEALYQDGRVYSATTLAQEFDTRNEWTFGFIAETWHRYTADFPAVYAVFQYMHKTESDLFGRLLDGYGADVDIAPPPGRSSFDLVALAFQQPFPNLIWRADFAVLYDVKGGILMQPGVTWSPRGDIQVNAFYNYIDTISGRETDNALSTVEHLNELTLRVMYQF